MLKDINSRICFMPDYDGGVGSGDSGGFGGASSSSSDGDSSASSGGVFGGAQQNADNPDGSAVGANSDDTYGGFDGFGSEQQAADQSGYSTQGIMASEGVYSYTSDYNQTTGVTTVNYTNSLGIGVDTHISTFADPLGIGSTFSTADELVTDALEFLNIDITELNINIAEDLVGVVVAAATSGLSIALGIKSLGLVADIAYSNKAITKQQYDTTKAVVAVASFMQGTISNMQAVSAISTAKNYGAITGVEAAIMGGLVAYSEYSSFTSLHTNLNKLGYTSGRTNDLENLGLFGVTNGGDGNNYYQGEIITDSNIQAIITAYVGFMNKEPEIVDDVFLRMAGGVMVDNYLAGGDLWNPVHSVVLVNNGMIGINAGISSLGTWLTEGSGYLEQVAQSSVRNYR